MTASTLQTDGVQLTGMVDSVVHANQETGFAIMRLLVDKEQRAKLSDRLVSKRGHVTIVGPNLSHLPPGEILSLTGKVVNHKSYGLQVQVEEFILSQPKATFEIERFLASNLKMINKVRAKAIVSAFGEATLDIMEKQPDRLGEIEGIGPKTLASIKEEWQSFSYDRQVLVFLTRIGISQRFLSQLKKKYNEDVIGRIQADPYCLARDIKGIGFKTADLAARRLGLNEISTIRVRAVALHVLDESRGTGHCFAYTTELLQEVRKHMNVAVPDQYLIDGIMDGVRNKILIMEDQRIYSPTLYDAEVTSADRLARIIKAPRPSTTVPCQEAFKVAVQSSKIPLSPTQQQAVAQALGSKVSVLTGGPGTGKTTTLQAIVAGFKHLGLPVSLLAPTGRASKRMQEMTGLEACTIHRELYSIEKGFSPRLHGVVFVDEVSMLDILTLKWALKLAEDWVILVFIGDQDQLPSVGPGAVLRDLINCGVVPCTRLTEIFRQAAGSDIVVNAHAVNQGTLAKINRMGRACGIPTNTDFMLCSLEDGDAQLRAAIWLATSFARRQGFNPLTDVQVVAPGHNGTVGVSSLNIELQSALNPSPADRIQRKEGVIWGVGDRLMNVQNNYQLGVFNGDQGQLIQIGRSTDGHVTGVHVQFGDRVVEVPTSWFDKIHLAYASTIHKVQGSEYPFVIVVLHPSHYMLLQRNLLYTALTRARKLCVLVSHPSALATALRNQQSNQRNTLFAERIAHCVRLAA